MCSIIVASAMGMMVMMAVMARPVSMRPSNRLNTVLSHTTGKPTQGACATPEKSTSPSSAAATYDTTTPMRMGMMRIMPRPQMLHTMMTAMAMTATSQFVEQFEMAEPASMSPMLMTMGPVTTGGKNLMTR